MRGTTRPTIACVVALAAVLALPLAGCGSSPKPPPPGSPSAAENLIERGDLNAAPPGSPERALLGWWRSIQYGDLPGYLDALAEPLRASVVRTGAARHYLPLATSQLIRARPKVVDTELHGGRATIFARVDIRTPLGSSRYQTSSVPQAFTAVRQGGEWKIADDEYVRAQARLVAEARAAAAAAEQK